MRQGLIGKYYSFKQGDSLPTDFESRSPTVVQIESDIDYKLGSNTRRRRYTQESSQSGARRRRTWAGRLTFTEAITLTITLTLTLMGSLPFAKDFAARLEGLLRVRVNETHTFYLSY